MYFLAKNRPERNGCGTSKCMLDIFMRLWYTISVGRAGRRDGKSHHARPVSRDDRSALHPNKKALLCREGVVEYE